MARVDPCADLAGRDLDPSLPGMQRVASKNRASRPLGLPVRMAMSMRGLGSAIEARLSLLTLSPEPAQVQSPCPEPAVHCSLQAREQRDPQVPPGGSVTVRGRTEQAGSSILLSAIDTGKGMPG